MTHTNEDWRSNVEAEVTAGTGKRDVGRAWAKSLNEVGSGKNGEHNLDTVLQQLLRPCWYKARKKNAPTGRGHILSKQIENTFLT